MVSVYRIANEIKYFEPVVVFTEQLNNFPGLGFIWLRVCSPLCSIDPLFNRQGEYFLYWRALQMQVQLSIYSPKHLNERYCEVGSALQCSGSLGVIENGLGRQTIAPSHTGQRKSFPTLPFPQILLPLPMTRE